VTLPTPDTPHERDEKATDLAAKTVETARVLAKEDVETARVLAAERAELARVLEGERTELARVVARDLRRIRWENRVLYGLAIGLAVAGRL
jgi:hypothetical protein